MTHKMTLDHWKKLLPQSYTWLTQDLELSVGKSSPSGTELNVVMVKAGKDDNGNGQGGEPLKVSALDGKSSQLEALVKKSQWDGKASGLFLTLDNQNYLLVPTVRGASNPLQLARQWGIEIAKRFASYQTAQVALHVPTEYDALSVFEGFAGSFYDQVNFRGASAKKVTKTYPKKVAIVTEQSVSDHQKKCCLALLRATTFTRFLQDAPANWLDTEQFALIAKEHCADIGVKCKIFGEPELAKEKMHMMLSVSRGSTLPAQMIVMEIDGKDNNQTCALVGKGLTFDAGGISLKPSLAMGEMKYDMSGGAAVLGAMIYLAEIKPPTKVVGLIGCCENMPSGEATKPGDVITARNGKTVEIANTDAEGRLVLGDVLNYTATTYKPAMMINAATLTGAVLAALGHNGGAIMSNDEKLATYVKKVADDVGEPFWQLPLWPDMEKDIRGECSDLVNIARPNVMAGTIIGGIFLREFVENTKWAHLDIAGVAWGCKATGFPGQGGSAYAVRTMAEACLRFESLK